jgi:hypothetical protein
MAAHARAAARAPARGHRCPRRRGVFLAPNPHVPGRSAPVAGRARPVDASMLGIPVAAGRIRGLRAVDGGRRLDEESVVPDRPGRCPASAGRNSRGASPIARDAARARGRCVAAAGRAWLLDASVSGISAAAGWIPKLPAVDGGHGPHDRCPPPARAGRRPGAAGGRSPGAQPTDRAADPAGGVGRGGRQLAPGVHAPELSLCRRGLVRLQHEERRRGQDFPFRRLLHSSTRSLATRKARRAGGDSASRSPRGW